MGTNAVKNSGHFAAGNAVVMLKSEERQDELEQKGVACPRSSFFVLICFLS